VIHSSWQRGPTDGIGRECGKLSFPPGGGRGIRRVALGHAEPIADRAATGLIYHDVTALLTPTFVSWHGIRAELAMRVSLDVDGRYTSRMMLTNTNDPRFVVPASWYADAGATFRVARQSVLVQVRNLFDRRVYTGGYPGPAVGSSDPSAMEPYYYTLAPRNLSVTARVTF
jgi:hypothetical protein